MNTQLEAEAAEFFVLAHLLLHKIPSFKNYTGHRDYDIVAINSETKKSVTIQVKSRYRAGAKGFILSNVNADFVVFCFLNRPYKNLKEEQPKFYIVPASEVKPYITGTTIQKFYPDKIVDFEKQYLENWKLIEKELQ